MSEQFLPDSFFSETKPGRLFLKSAIPGAIGMLASSFYYLLEGVLVGRMLGAEAFAGLNLGLPFVFINFAVSDLIGVGSSVPIAIQLGRKRVDEANNIFTCALIMIVLAGVVLGSFLFFASPWIFRIMGADDHLIPLAVEYVRGYAIFSPITTMIFAIDNFLRISGKIKYSLFMNLFMASVSIILEVLFLVVLKGGIWSAAVGTSIGMALAVTMGITPFLRKKLVLKLRRPHFHIRVIGNIFTCGLPTFLSNIAGRVTAIVMNTMLLMMGGSAAVSVYGILMAIDGVVNPLLYGTCDSVQPAIGYNYGAKLYKRVTAIEKWCFSSAAIMSFISFFVLLLFPLPCVNLFLKGSDSSIISLGVTAVKLFAMTYLTRWISFAIQSFSSAIGKPISASVISVSVAMVFPLIMIMILRNFGINGMWLVMPFTMILAAMLAIPILIKQLRIMKQDKEAILDL